MDEMRIRPVPPLWRRLAAVIYRHKVVYDRNWVTNSFGVILEPVMYFVAMAWGLASSIGEIDGLPYLEYLVPGQIMVGVIFSATFETSYGTYFRLEMDHNYDSIVVTPLSAAELFWAELLYVGLRCSLFSAIVLGVFAAWGLVASPWAVLVPVVSFFAGVGLGTMGYFANRLVKSINQFNYFITGVMSPMILFSGTLFPLDRMPPAVASVAHWLPFYPAVHLSRMLTTGRFQEDLWVMVAYLLIVPWPLGYFAVKCMVPKLIK
jgi:lipooligosaccharide transport system permease protein